MTDHMDGVANFAAPLAITSHYCEPFGGRVYCDADECRRCDRAE